MIELVTLYDISWCAHPKSFENKHVHVVVVVVAVDVDVALHVVVVFPSPMYITESSWVS